MVLSDKPVICDICLFESCSDLSKITCARWRITWCIWFWCKSINVSWSDLDISTLIITIRCVLRSQYDDPLFRGVKGLKPHFVPARSILTYWLVNTWRSSGSVLNWSCRNILNQTVSKVELGWLYLQKKQLPWGKNFPIYHVTNTVHFTFELAEFFIHKYEYAFCAKFR